MENETEEVLAPEILLTEDEDSTSTVGNAVVLGLATIGVFKVGQFAKAKMPFRISVTRKTKVVKTPVVPAPTHISVVE